MNKMTRPIPIEYEWVVKSYHKVRRGGKAAGIPAALGGGVDGHGACQRRQGGGWRDEKKVGPVGQLNMAGSPILLFVEETGRHGILGKSL